MSFNFREINDKYNKDKKNNKDYQIIKNKTIKLLINYVSTLINNKNEVNQNLDFKDFDIILSSGNGRKKLISSLIIVNTKFDPKTYSKNNKEKFVELKNIVDLQDEEGINLEEEFETIKFNLIPKLEPGIKFDLSFCDLHIFKQFETDKIFDKNFFKEGNNDKDLLVIYCTKLDGNKHKFKKLCEFIDKAEEDEDLWKKIRKILLIFEVKQKEEIGEEYDENLHYIIREANEEKFSLLFNIRKENDMNTPNEIFLDSKKSKTFYFLLDKNNYIKEHKAFYSYDSIKEVIDEHAQKKNICTFEEYNQKIETFYEFFSFLKNIKEVKYNFYLSYNFEIVLTYDPNLNKLLIKNIIFNRLNGEFLPEEYKKLKLISEIVKPNNEDLKEIKCKKIDIDFSDMTCIKCGQKIEDNAELFYCYECKEKYCYKCVINHLENNSGKDKYIDPKHNLIFFKTRDKKNFEAIEQYKLGKNTFVNSENLDRFKYVKCNGCANKFAKSPRFICLSCCPGKKNSDGYNDYCQKCIEHMMNDDNEGKEIQKSRDYVYDRDFFLLDGENCYMSHDHKNHIYLMVPLSSDDQEEPYWDY